MQATTDFETKIDYRKFNRQTLGIEDIVLPPDVLPRTRNNREGQELLEKAYRYWNSLKDFRTRRKRARNYMRGNQWGDVVYVNGSQMTEEEYIKSQGRVPLKNNQIQQIRKSIMGQWRGNESKPIVMSRDRKDARAEEMVTNALHKVYDINKIIEKDTRAFDEFILSGMAVGKTTYEYWKERNHNDVFCKNPNVNRVFFNNDIEDPANDIDFIGEFMDISTDKLVAAFAKTDDDKEWIESIYQARNFDTNPGSRALTSHRTDNLDFLTPADESKCRVFEIWQLKMVPVLHTTDQLNGKRKSTRMKKEDIDAINRQRIADAQAQGVPAEQALIVEYEKAFEQIWEVYYLSPYGDILYYSETPYTHESHPFTVLLYPLIDGDVWGIYEDIIDQQRYINRMIILFDFIISASAKGVLLVNEDAIPDDSSLDEIATEWVKYNGVVKLKLKPGITMEGAAKQVSANATNIGLQEMIALQMRLLQDISGVNGAIQGQEPKAGTSGTLFAQQAQNSATNLRDYFETFQNNFKQSRDWKMLKLALQYYDKKRNITSTKTSDKFQGTDFWDPDVIKDMEFDLIIAQSNETPAYRDMMETSLRELFTANAINIVTYLENSSMPWADKILDSVKQQQEAMAQGQTPVITPEMAQQAQQANPQAMGMMQKIMGGGQRMAA